MSTIISEDKNNIRRYLLGQLEDAEEERLEMRLLTDPEFGEEFDTVVDEIADEYAGNDIQGAERNLVEQHFLKSPERRLKVQFSRELLERAATERGNGRRAVVATEPATRSVVANEPGFFERVSAFWRNQSFAFRVAAALATIVVVVGLGYIASRQDSSPGTLASITLAMNTSDRASGTEVKTVKLEPAISGVRVELLLPEQNAPGQDYRVELLDEQQRPRNLTIKERTDKALIVEIPASEIPRGTYLIYLYAGERRIRGTYSFNVV